MNEFPIKALKAWFNSERRDLPWRDDPSPYAVWVSEMMLQQTQVDVVVPYFLRWMQRFPSIRDLAEASLDEVIKVWEGLGYYSRARYLHEGAIYICENFGGNLPDNYEDLRKIKGLGPYTLGAILSFAFHKKISAVDGNVIRVLARYFCLNEDISKPKTVKAIRDLAEGILPDFEPWVVNEALIELGATVCGRKPQCGKCPLKVNCMGYSSGLADQLPIKTAKIKTEYLFRAVAVIVHKDDIEDHVLIQRGKSGQVMSDLHEFPYFETSAEGIEPDHLVGRVQGELCIAVRPYKSLLAVSHSFTRFQVRLSPVICQSEKKTIVKGYFWHPLSKIHELAFSSGHRRILQGLEW